MKHFLQESIHGHNLAFDLKVLKYLFFAWVLTHRDPDILDGLISLIQKWST